MIEFPRRRAVEWDGQTITRIVLDAFDAMIQFLLDHALGILRPIGTQHWVLLVRRLRHAEGWLPPMLLFAAMALLFLLGQGFGLLAGIAAVRVFNYAALATWFVVGLFACAAVTIDGVNNLRRFAFSGLLRPRWWFELSRLTWMVLLFAALSTPLLHFAPLPQLVSLGDAVFCTLPWMFLAFMVFSTGGYLVSGMTGRRRRGRAFECVQYFYWLFGGTAALTFSVIWLPMRVGWVQPMTVIACIIAASLMGILLLTVANRMDRNKQKGQEADKPDRQTDLGKR
jgi:hypothetical protein